MTTKTRFQQVINVDCHQEDKYKIIMTFIHKQLTPTSKLLEHLDFVVQLADLPVLEVDVLRRLGDLRLQLRDERVLLGEGGGQ